MNIANLLEAVAPDPTKTSFPAPRLVVGTGTGGTFTSESFNLGGELLPGQWLLTDATRVFGWEIRKGWGLTGATIVPIGDDLMSVKFAVKIWASVDAARYRALLKTVLRKPVGLVPGSTTAAGLGIDQPQVNDMGVTSVVVKSVTPLMNPLVASGGKGPWTASIELLEYRKPVLALAKPTTTIPDKAPPNPTAEDNLATENARLADQFAKKANALSQALSGGPKP